MLELPKGQPVKLFEGEDFSDDVLRMTTLTQYLELETWTPVLASLLVCGIQPQLDCLEIPSQGAMTLDNRFAMGNEDAFHVARHILTLWNSRENAPSKVRPADFIQWCKTKQIDTTWLDEMEFLPKENMVVAEVARG